MKLQINPDVEFPYSDVLDLIAYLRTIWNHYPTIPTSALINLFRGGAYPVQPSEQLNYFRIKYPHLLKVYDED